MQAYHSLHQAAVTVQLLCPLVEHLMWDTSKEFLSDHCMSRAVASHDDSLKPTLKRIQYFTLSYTVFDLWPSSHTSLSYLDSIHFILIYLALFAEHRPALRKYVA